MTLSDFTVGKSCLRSISLWPASVTFLVLARLTLIVDCFGYDSGISGIQISGRVKRGTRPLARSCRALVIRMVFHLATTAEFTREAAAAISSAESISDFLILSQRSQQFIGCSSSTISANAASKNTLLRFLVAIHTFFKSTVLFGTVILSLAREEKSWNIAL